jgi:LPS sulfotransferase NodH
MFDLVGRLPAPDIRRICIVTNGRTGSELLVDLLNGHPRMLCEGEILGTPRRDPFRFVRGRTIIARRRQHVDAYGFKINVHYLALANRRWTMPTLIEALVRDGFGIVRLRRENLLRQAISTMRAGPTRTFHVTEAVRSVPLHVDPINVLSVMRQFESSDEFLDKLLAKVETVEVTYEDDIEPEGRRDATLSRVFTLAGLEPATVPRSALKQTTPRSLTDAVENHQEIRTFLTGTRYEQYLFD